MDSDGISLLCTADGDPAPTVTWVSPDGTEKVTLPIDPWDKDIFQVHIAYCDIESNAMG